MPRGTLKVVLVNANVPENTGLLQGIDPYVIFTCGTQRQKSTVSLGPTPQWNETFHFTVSGGISELKAKIIDKDDYSVDDVLGRAIIPLEPVFVEGSIPEIPYIVMKDEEPRGEIWIALSFKPLERIIGCEEECSGGLKNSEASDVHTRIEENTAKPN